MIIAVCDPKGIAIEAIKTILYHDKGLSDRISRIYEFWNMEQLLDASRDSSFDCIVFPNYCNSHNSVVCSLSCGYNRFPLVEHNPRYTLIVRDILYWETARSLWTQYLKAIPGKEEKVKRAIRGILADYEKEERDIIYLESKTIVSLSIWMAYAKRRKALHRSMLHWTKRNMNLLHLHSYESIKVTL